jgi:peptidylprolyl isomerase
MSLSRTPESAHRLFVLGFGALDSPTGIPPPFGRVVAGMDVVRAIKAGSEASNGAVTDPDVMTRTRTALALPEGERPTVRVATGAALQAEVERVRAERGAAFTICDVQPPAEVAGG